MHAQNQSDANRVGESKIQCKKDAVDIIESQRGHASVWVHTLAEENVEYGLSLHLEKKLELIDKADVSGLDCCPVVKAQEAITRLRGWVAVHLRETRWRAYL